MKKVEWMALDPGRMLLSDIFSVFFFAYIRNESRARVERAFAAVRTPNPELFRFLPSSLGGTGGAGQLFLNEI